MKICDCVVANTCLITIAHLKKKNTRNHYKWKTGIFIDHPIQSFYNIFLTQTSKYNDINRLHIQTKCLSSIQSFTEFIMDTDLNCQYSFRMQ